MLYLGNKNDQLFNKIWFIFVKKFVLLLLGTRFFLFTKYLYLVFPISTGRTLAFVGVYSLKYVNCNNISLIYGKLERENVITQRKKIIHVQKFISIKIDSLIYN